MRIDMEFQGLHELIKAFERAANDNEMRETNVNIVKKSQPIVKKIMSEEIPKSKDISISGRCFGRRSKVSAHAADSVPIGNVKTKGISASVEVGWNLNDTSEYFYMKFINWGASSKLRWGTLTHPPVNFVEKAAKRADRELQSIAEQEYQTFLNSTLK